jgi:carbonic anhydrase
MYTNVTTTNAFKLSSLIPYQIPSYYRYPGSLTNPACAEVVEWHVVEDPVITISERQMVELQALKDSNNNEVPSIILLKFFKNDVLLSI